MPRKTGESGLTLIELVVATALLAILASAVLPLYEVSIKREREIELRYALRTLRRALDDFHRSYCASGGVAPDCTALTQGGGRPSAPGQPPATQGQGQGQAPGQPSAGFPQTATAPTQSSAGQFLQVPLIDYTRYDPIDSKGYPKNLKELADGVPVSGGGTDEDEKIKFLRRVPLDPMIPHDLASPSDDNSGWGIRCYQDAPDNNIWCRKNVYDVYTKSTGTALDGSKYRDW